MLSRSIPLGICMHTANAQRKMRKRRFFGIVRLLSKDMRRLGVWLRELSLEGDLLGDLDRTVRRRRSQ